MTTNRRWLGTMGLLGALGCGGTASKAPDGSAGEQDGAAIDDSSSPSDGPGASDAGMADAGSMDAGCVPGCVSFAILASAGAPPYCLGAPGACSSDWLDIRPADGGASLGLDMTCETQCSDCQPVACSKLCVAAERLGDGGARTTWDGTYLTSGTCGVRTACVAEASAPAGNYVARFCGYAESSDASTFGCTGTSTPTCTETPFQWPPAPGSPSVQGILGSAAADAGS
jgi:hypothetical protein